MKSKAEIVVETLLHYNIKNRGYNRAEGQCTYLDKSSGNKCAVGRCIQDSEIEKVCVFEQEQINQGNGSPSAAKLAANFNDLDSLLSPEYRGHDYAFWGHLQFFHDSSYMWNEDGFDVSDGSLTYITRSFGAEVGEAVRVALAEKTA
jgi:hypothetical protein